MIKILHYDNKEGDANLKIVQIEFVTNMLLAWRICCPMLYNLGFYPELFMYILHVLQCK